MTVGHPESKRAEVNSLQAERMSELLSENERLGAENVQLREEVARLHAAVEQLSPWRDLVRGRLRVDDLPSANQQIDLLWSYVHKMGTPSHRIISAVSRVFLSNPLGRAVRKFFLWLSAIRQA